MTEARSASSARQDRDIDPEIKRLAEAWSSKSLENRRVLENVRSAFQDALNLRAASEARANVRAANESDSISVDESRHVGNPLHRYGLNTQSRGEHDPNGVIDETWTKREKRADAVPLHDASNVGEPILSSTIHRSIGGRPSLESTSNSLRSSSSTIHNDRLVPHGSFSLHQSDLQKNVGSERELHSGRDLVREELRTSLSVAEKDSGPVGANLGRKPFFAGDRSHAPRETSDIRANPWVIAGSIRPDSAPDRTMRSGVDPSGRGESPARFESHSDPEKSVARETSISGAVFRIVRDRPFESTTRPSFPPPSAVPSFADPFGTPIVRNGSSTEAETQGPFWSGELSGIRETLHRLETDFRRLNRTELPSGKRSVSSER